jgi:hypothetical protein
MTNFLNLSYDEILKERAKILLHSQYDRDWQAVLKQMCKTDPVFFFNFFCFTKDPKKKPANLPFILYPYQRNLIRWLEDLLVKEENGLIEKSRQMGITWIMMTWLLYHWLFTPDFISLVGSRKEELVDKRDKDDTLFYEIDYNLSRLPTWILPKRFNPVKDRRHLLLVNPENGASIIGESSNKDFGRGGTFNCIFMDEFTTWPEASASWDGCSEASKIKIPVSTPKPATFFKTLRFSNQMKGRVKTIHWREHPEKNDEWYEDQKEKYSAETIAQEIDISYDVTGRGKVYPEFDAVPIGNYSYNPKLPLYTASDYGLDSTATIWAQQNTNGDVFIIDSYQNHDLTIDFYIPFFTGKKYTPTQLRKNGFQYTNDELRKIEEHKKFKRARHFGDPAGKQRTVVIDKTVLKTLSQSGIHVFTNERAQSFPARKEATKMLLRRLYIDEKQKAFIEAIQQSRYPKRKESSQATSPVSKPVHDQFSHYRSALEYLAVNLRLVPGKPRKLNYLKGKPKLEEDGTLHEDQLKKEKKRRIVRYSFRSYGKG